LPLIGGAYLSCGYCPSGYQCDTNTGTCRRFREKDGDLPQFSCGNCPRGTLCDSNTGICRTFRFPGNDDQISPSRCAYITCPAGFLCDDNTGTCRKFR
uniref:Uncharacterized protein n=1 Tax=Angiostrongylus cantonensis TaxID=6313 RepID=A0A0K0D698_ANGCA